MEADKAQAAEVPAPETDAGEPQVVPRAKVWLVQDSLTLTCAPTRLAGGYKCKEERIEVLRTETIQEREAVPRPTSDVSTSSSTGSRPASKYGGVGLPGVCSVAISCLRVS
jgi:hypothetical protein